MNLERIVGSIITEGGPKSFVLHTQTGILEMDTYAEPDNAQLDLSVVQQQRLVQLIAERAEVSFAKVRLGQYYDAKSDRWVDVLREGWHAPDAGPAAPVEEEKPGAADAMREADAAIELALGAPEADAATKHGSGRATAIDEVVLPNASIMLEKAIRIAVEAHAGQVDKAGDPYILHPLRMMTRMETLPEKTVAVLHDVVEDSAWTLDALRDEGFSDEVVEAVDGLTRRPGESYDAFVERAAQHPLARRVKLADLEDNMDMRRIAVLADKDLIRLARYQRAWRRLKDLS